MSVTSNHTFHCRDGDFSPHASVNTGKAMDIEYVALQLRFTDSLNPYLDIFVRADQEDWARRVAEEFNQMCAPKPKVMGSGDDHEEMETMNVIF